MPPGPPAHTGRLGASRSVHVPEAPVPDLGLAPPLCPPLPVRLWGALSHEGSL